MAIRALYQIGEKQYVHLFDKLHWIETMATRTGVFGQNVQVTEDAPDLEKGFVIGTGSFLLRDSRSKKIYLVTNNSKYHIASPAAKTEYQFNGPVFPQKSDCQQLADLACNVLPVGPDITI